MLIFKTIVVVAVAVIACSILTRNINRWAAWFRQYMLGQANKIFGNDIGWDKPWALFLSKAMIVFFWLIFIVLVYVGIFSIWEGIFNGNTTR